MAYAAGEWQMADIAGGKPLMSDSHAAICYVPRAIRYFLSATSDPLVAIRYPGGLAPNDGYEYSRPGNERRKGR